MFVKIPDVPFLEDDVDEDEYKRVKALCERHNFRLSYFGADTITFYNVENIDQHGYVHIADRFCMNIKEFAAFGKVLEKLDRALEDNKKMLVAWATNKSLALR